MQEKERLDKKQESNLGHKIVNDENDKQNISKKRLTKEDFHKKPHREQNKNK